MGTVLHPYKFKPQLKTVLWGGEKIIPLKGKVLTQARLCRN